MNRWVTAGAVFVVTYLMFRDTPVRPMTEAEQRRFRKLVPSVRRALTTLRQALANEGIPTFVGQTYQTAEDNAENLEEGRSATSTSWHRAGRAVDLYIVDPRTGEPDMRGKRTDLYKVYGRVARAHGWRWLGTGTLTGPTGKTFTDPHHLEYREGRTWAQAMQEVGREAIPV